MAHADGEQRDTRIGHPLPRRIWFAGVVSPQRLEA